MSDINIRSSTQKIFVDPASSSVAVVNAGPIGPGGPMGTVGTTDPTTGRMVINEVEMGDTGPRAIGNLLLNGWATSWADPSLLNMRRMGNFVYMTSGALTSVAATSDIFYNLPAGFRAVTGNWLPNPAMGGAEQFTWLKTFWDGNLYLNHLMGGNYLFSAIWPTNDPWPTVLPGTTAIIKLEEEV